MAIIIALMSMLLLSALGAATILNTSAETLIASNFRDAEQGVHAADAALALAVGDLDALADWNAVLDGSAVSSFIDGPPGGSRTLADGSLLDLSQLVNMTNCRKPTTCGASDLIANTAERPWGANNPVWRMFAYGPLATLLADHAVQTPFYIVVFVADDPSENDGDPFHDGDRAANPGTGTLTMRAEAFGPRGAHQVIEATVRRGGTDPAVRVLSWRHVR